MHNPVEVGLADEEGFPHQGYMDFVDNRLDPDTGTMIGRAVLPNPDLSLLARACSHACGCSAASKYQALLIPDAAIGSDQAQQFV